ncbi:MAG: ATP-dependent zinc metalloprotease FtsH [Sphingomonadaceae bacterium]
MKDSGDGKGTSRRSVALFAVGALLVLTIATLPTMQMQSSGDAASEIGLSQVAAYAKAGQITGIVEDGGNLEVTLTNGAVVKSRREPDLGLTQSLRNYGVTDEQLARIDFRVRGQSDWRWLGPLFWMLPLLFIILMMVLFSRQGNSQTGGGNVFSFSKSRARRIAADQPSIHFSDVAGVEEAKEELQEVVEFLRSPQKFSAVGARIPKGVLLVGPPGTGKTLMARAVAGEASVPFFHISGSEFVELFVGVGASRVRDLFDEAKKNAPCIVFIDEIDAVGRQRGRGLGGGNDEREQTLNQILVEMDGFDKNTGIVVIAATNRPDILDTALLRPGRFDRRVVLDSPDLAGRLDILKVHARGKPLAPDVELDKIARQTPGFSGADLENLLNEAAILAARRNETMVTRLDLEEAIDRVIAGPERKGRLISEQEKEITAYHEVGHTLVAYYMPHLDPVHKVTVIARGQSGGYTRLLPMEDRHLWTRSQMSEMLAFAMGGLAAEDLVFGETTTGPSNDLQQATEIARKMVTMYGMSEKLGTVSLASNGIVDYMGADLMEPRNYSEHTAALVDAEIRRMIDEGRAKAREVLVTHRQQLVSLSELLKEKETLTGDEVALLLGPRPQAESHKVA